MFESDGTLVGHGRRQPDRMTRLTDRTILSMASTPVAAAKGLCSPPTRGIQDGDDGCRLVESDGATTSRVRWPDGAGRVSADEREKPPANATRSDTSNGGGIFSASFSEGRDIGRLLGQPRRARAEEEISSIMNAILTRCLHVSSPAASRLVVTEESCDPSSTLTGRLVHRSTPTFALLAGSSERGSVERCV